MKEEIEDLVRTYKRRVKDLDDMALSSSTDVAKARLITKRNVYKVVVTDLEDLLSHEQDKA